jgi:hypothetical protein
MKIPLPGMPAHGHIDKDGFRLRGIELARIDAFSDVVFGFALTLLVVSLEVPKTFAELHATLRGFIPFSICFYFLMIVWHKHYQFFRRFGTHDTGTIVINGFLLFVVLFYVYPLKFLFTVVTYSLMGFGADFFDSARQVSELMLLFAVAMTLIHLLMAGLYGNGYRQRHKLELTPLEQALTRGWIRQNLMFTGIGLLSGALAMLVPAQFAGYTGWTYLLMWPLGKLNGMISNRSLKKLPSAPQIPAPA